MFNILVNVDVYTQGVVAKSINITLDNYSKCVHGNSMCACMCMCVCVTSRVCVFCVDNKIVKITNGESHIDCSRLTKLTVFFLSYFNKVRCMQSLKIFLHGVLN